MKKLLLFSSLFALVSAVADVQAAATPGAQAKALSRIFEAVDKGDTGVIFKWYPALESTEDRGMAFQYIFTNLFPRDFKDSELKQLQAMGIELKPQVPSVFSSASKDWKRFFERELKEKEEKEARPASPIRPDSPSRRAPATPVQGVVYLVAREKQKSGAEKRQRFMIERKFALDPRVVGALISTSFTEDPKERELELNVPIRTLDQLVTTFTNLGEMVATDTREGHPIVNKSWLVRSRLFVHIPHSLDDAKAFLKAAEYLGLDDAVIDAFIKSKFLRWDLTAEDIDDLPYRMQDKIALGFVDAFSYRALPGYQPRPGVRATLPQRAYDYIATVVHHYGREQHITYSLVLDR